MERCWFRELELDLDLEKELFKRRSFVRRESEKELFKRRSFVRRQEIFYVDHAYDGGVEGGRDVTDRPDDD